MALVLKKLYLGYFWLFDELADPRLKDSFLVSSPLVAILIPTIYLYFVFAWGPQFMKNRKPYKLKKLIIVYNISQILVNAAMLPYAISLIFKLDWNCARIDYSQSPEALLTLRLHIGFYLLKIYDLLDTVFFILRKSTRQVNFLHVYHHWGMILGTFITLNFAGGGELVWTGIINAIIHTVMYSYYLLSIVNKDWKGNFKFKKFLTQIQLVSIYLV
ncbi:hypothetical protein NQ314_008563 [Rhamnusium bicolor]|uniref:Elongation of very long chain fatty acids protein n=1 Tax=Rhamnusium bicolor TaxID=1586634 RepID=A0AAV8Y9X8_9CUCU|nr:hypothetical protein NQ314_008563 [Rhamnusium bicolor]